jgi:glycosyltransferase involved in cell wall biosynthesis
MWLHDRQRAIVTVGVPAHDAERTIERCLDSVLRQDFAKLCVLVADNASTDSTELLVRRIGAGDPRVEYHRHHANHGPTYNFRFLRRLALSKYFMWLGADDWLGSRDYVSRCVGVLESNPAVVSVCGKVRYYAGARPWDVGASLCCASPDAATRVRQFYAAVYDNGSFYGLTRLDVTREIVLRSWFSADWWFVAALAAVGHVVTADDVVLNRSYEQRPMYARQFATWNNLPWVLAEYPREAMVLGAGLECLGFAAPFRDMPLLVRARLAYDVTRQLLARLGNNRSA